MLAYFSLAAVLPTVILGHQIIPCPGGSVIYSVDFVPTAASATMTLAIQSTFLGETRDVYIGPLANACNTMVPACPVVANQQVTQGATIPVSTELHGGVPVQLRVTMTNAAGAVNVCSLINLIVH